MGLLIEAMSKVVLECGNTLDIPVNCSSSGLHLFVSTGYPKFHFNCKKSVLLVKQAILIKSLYINTILKIFHE